MQLKTFYKYMSNFKLELFKGVMWFLLILNNKKLYQSYYSFVGGKYGIGNIDYLFRITIIITIWLQIILGIIKLFKFLKRNAESLLLLGVAEIDILKLFFVKNYDFLLGYLYIKCLFCLFYKQSLIGTFTVSLIDACIFEMLIVIFYIAIQYRYVRFFSNFVLILFSVFLAMGKINYESIYGILTSKLMENLFYNLSWFSICCRILSISLLCLILNKILKQRGLIIDIDCRKHTRINKAGDLFHKWEKYSSVRVNYFWMYRDYDFIIWKIFSTIFLVGFCLQLENIFENILCGYVICLISTSYFLDIYRNERKRLIIYYMSDFTFFDFLNMHIKSSMVVVGDNIIAVLLLNSLRGYTYLLAALILCLLIFLVALFIDTAIYSKYPQKIYILDLIVIIVKMHIPVFNVSTWRKNYLSGRMKWSKLEYGRE